MFAELPPDIERCSELVCLFHIKIDLNLFLINIGVEIVQAMFSKNSIWITAELIN